MTIRVNLDSQSSVMTWFNINIATQHSVDINTYSCIFANHNGIVNILQALFVKTLIYTIYYCCLQYSTSVDISKLKSCETNHAVLTLNHMLNNT